MDVFENEIKTDQAKIRKIVYSAAGIGIVAVISIVAGLLFKDQYAYMATNLKGQTYLSGWPMKLIWYGIFVLAAAILGIVIVLLMVDRKHPALATGSKGVFINLQMISKTWVPWSNIKSIALEEGKNSKVTIYFYDFAPILEKQSSAKKSFLKENFKDGKPLIVEGKFYTGDFRSFSSAVLRSIEQGA